MKTRLIALLFTLFINQAFAADTSDETRIQIEGQMEQALDNILAAKNGFNYVNVAKFMDGCGVVNTALYVGTLIGGCSIGPVFGIKACHPIYAAEAIMSGSRFIPTVWTISSLGNIAYIMSLFVSRDLQRKGIEGLSYYCVTPLLNKARAIVWGSGEVLDEQFLAQLKPLLEDNAFRSQLLRLVLKVNDAKIWQLYLMANAKSVDETVDEPAIDEALANIFSKEMCCVCRIPIPEVLCDNTIANKKLMLPGCACLSMVCEACYFDAKMDKSTCPTCRKGIDSYGEFSVSDLKDEFIKKNK